MIKKPARGCRDILPQEMELRDAVLADITKVYRQSGYQKIKTPILENIENLTGSDGGDNLNMLFKILKRGDKLRLDNDALAPNDLVDLGLRYDLTLPLSRFYANNMEDLPKPFKAIQIGDVFRAERPQKGRYRSFVQCDIDILGDESAIAEADLLDTTARALSGLGFKDFTIEVNDRRIIKSLIVAAGFEAEAFERICISLDKMDKIGREGVIGELEEKGYDSQKVARLMDVFQAAASGGMEGLKDQGTPQEVIEAVSTVLAAVGQNAKGAYQVVFNPYLIRGMGYYTGMIFEIKYGKYGYSLAGGGRYDKMIGKFIGQDVPAVGFSIGFERIIPIMMEEGLGLDQSAEKVALFFSPDKDDLASVMAYGNGLRDQGKTVGVFPMKKKFGKQVKRVEEQGYGTVLVYGRDTE